MTCNPYHHQQLSAAAVSSNNTLCVFVVAGGGGAAVIIVPTTFLYTPEPQLPLSLPFYLLNDRLVGIVQSTMLMSMGRALTTEFIYSLNVHRRPLLSLLLYNDQLCSNHHHHHHCNHCNQRQQRLFTILSAGRFIQRRCGLFFVFRLNETTNI